MVRIDLGRPGGHQLARRRLPIGGRGERLRDEYYKNGEQGIVVETGS